MQHKQGSSSTAEAEAEKGDEDKKGEACAYQPQSWPVHGAKGLIKLIWICHKPGLLYGLTMMYVYQVRVWRVRVRGSRRHQDERHGA